MSCFGSEKGNLKHMGIERERGERNKEGRKEGGKEERREGRKEGGRLFLLEQPVFFRMTKRKI